VFLLECGFGVERFYLEYDELGLFKLLLTITLCIIPCCPIYCVCCLEDDKMSTLYSMVLISIICVFIGMWIWWFVDWILIVSGSLPDGNGVGLYNDM